jgi:hypothetical protein
MRGPDHGNHRDLRACADPYRSAHDRVRAVKGGAHLYPCVDCGGQASDWSLTADPMESWPVRRMDRDAVAWISPFVQDYEPRDSACHHRHDRDLDRGEESEDGLPLVPLSMAQYDGLVA